MTGVAHVWWLQEFVTADHGFSYLLGEALSQRAIGWLSKAVVANSVPVRDHFSPPIPREKVRVIPYGIEGFSATENTVDPAALRVLLLGRQTPRKGQRLALEAVSILNSESVHVMLRLVGSIRADYRRELEASAARLGVTDRIEIVEPTSTPHDDFSWANVVLMCSDNEAFGRVTVEALKSGRPVIGTRSGGTTDLICHGENGFLFDPGNARDLARYLSRLACEPDLLSLMSLHAEEGTLGRFSLDEERDAFLDLFSRAAPF
jgi:glycosyltransferase involved in cell wall biosynthesis